MHQQRLAKFKRLGRGNAKPGRHHAHRQRRAQFQIEIGVILGREPVENFVNRVNDPLVRPPTIGKRRLEPGLSHVAQTLVFTAIQVEQRVTHRRFRQLFIDPVAERLAVHERLVDGVERQDRIDFARPQIGRILSRDTHQVFQRTFDDWRTVIQFLQVDIGVGRSPPGGPGFFIGIKQHAAIFLREVDSAPGHREFLSTPI